MFAFNILTLRLTKTFPQLIFGHTLHVLYGNALNIKQYMTNGKNITMVTKETNP